MMSRLVSAIYACCFFLIVSKKFFEIVARVNTPSFSFALSISLLSRILLSVLCKAFHHPHHSFVPFGNMVLLFVCVFACIRCKKKRRRREGEKEEKERTQQTVGAETGKEKEKKKNISKNIY